MMKSRVEWVILLAILGAVGCGGGDMSEAPDVEAPAAVDIPPLDLSQAGNLMGKVKFEGTPSKKVRIRMGAEPRCDEQHSEPVYTENLEVNEGGTLKNVFVWVSGGIDHKFDPPQQPVALDQKGCVYQPHVFGVQIGQEIEIRNSDPTTHNIHPLPRQNREWNISQAPKTKALTRSFPRQEVMIPVKCNVHPWMKSYIGVVAHPYFAVTGGDGSFELKDLPPGNYTIQAWHEKLGNQELQITLEPKQNKEIEFIFTS